MYQPEEQRLIARRRARFYMLGEVGPSISQIWFVLHGYGQLARPFLESLGVLARSDRLLVAPEALSRFYLDAEHRAVGASWMTREARLREIEDYVEYLDAVREEVLGRGAPAEARCVAFGYSQGGATAARWVCRGSGRFERLILWGEVLPPDLDGEESWRRLRALRLTLIAGERDRYATAERRAAERERLAARKVAFEELTFSGGHRLDDSVLEGLGGS